MAQAKPTKPRATKKKRQLPTKGYLYAFDLGMASPALAVFDIESRKLMTITSVQPNEKLSHGERLYIIAKWVKEVVEQFEPAVVAIERGFTRYNNATQVIFRVHGLINYIFWDLPQVYYPPLSIKEAILNGKATKEALRKRILLDYPDIPFTGNDKDDDEADAFAVGLTYLIKECEMEWEKIAPKKKTTRRKKETE
ncbi:hypothetical protein QB910_000051 [Dabrowskivirus KKP3916]|uniref:Holliday junction nuclease RuvC n=1 Tax=Alicyclobacillus phage KKP_3916 TaxID=3040651 RepID=A0AAT9V8I5_9CAUD|nr:hypothetical protein QB910_000051 [Alicyclobacillus phage KKP 3916]